MINEKWVVCDIDGTISNDGHRKHLAAIKQWDDYHAECVYDPIIENITCLVTALALTNPIMMLTGRNARYREHTHEWLRKHELFPHVDALLMRPDNDYSHSAEMKVRLLTEYFGGAQEVIDNVWFVLEDNERNTTVLRDFGLTVLQTAPGGY